MSTKVEIQSRKIIKPIVSTPPTARHYKLGFTDEFVPVIYLGIVLFFSKNSNHSPKLVSKLEKSLEKTLTRFYPFAGRYIEEILTVDCDDQGAEFIEAKVNMKLEDVVSSDANLKLTDKFIPFESGTGYGSTDPLLAAQVTTFECGGVAIGVSVAHKISDASTISTFLNEWAVMNRVENDGIEFIGPGFNSSSLFPGRGIHSFTPPPVNDEILNRYIIKKLSFSETEISNLKTRAVENGKYGVRQWSKVQLVSSIIWKALIDVDRVIHNHQRESILLQPINLREKMASKIHKHSCGNLVGIFATESKNVETTEELAYVLNDSVKKTVSNYSKVYHNTEEGQTMVFNSYSCITNINPTLWNVVMLTSMCNFPFYEADFGFGKPDWVASGSVPMKNSVCLMDGVNGNGVEAIVFLEAKDVPYFEKALKVDVFAA